MPPIVASHIYLDDDNFDKANSKSVKAKAMRYDAVDVLYISPFVVDPNKKFLPPDETWDPKHQSKYTERIEEVIKAARSMNPHIKLIAMQWYGASDNLEHLKDAKEIDTYTTSVADLLKTYQHKTLITDDGKTVSARLDGWDIDYEWWDDDKTGRHDGNMQPTIGTIVSQIRKKLDALSKTPPFQLSMTPASTQCLEQGMKSSVDLLNMQTYSGGVGVEPDDYLQVFGKQFKSKLVWGLELESFTRNAFRVSQTSNPINEVHSTVTSEGYAGVFTWRMNSDNYLYQNALQVQLYNKFHNKSLQSNFTLDQVCKWWKLNTGRGDADGKASIFTPSH